MSATKEKLHDKIEKEMKHNLINEFFNYAYGKFKGELNTIEATEQERLEKHFQEWYDNRKLSFEESVRPLMKYLGHNHHPHTSAYVTSDTSELLEGKETFLTEDYILD
jgi:hypothetical protein